MTRVGQAAIAGASNAEIKSDVEQPSIDRSSRLARVRATKSTPGSALGCAGGADGSMKNTSVGRSILFALGGLCGGSIAGAGVAMFLWNGLKDRFGSGVATDASGDFEADGGVAIDDVEAEVIGIGFDVPASGSGEFDADGDIAFSGDAAVDIGGFAPWKVILSVAAVFGIVVAAFAWLAERHIAANEKQDAILSKLNTFAP